MTPSGPQSITIGTGDNRRILTAVFKLCDQVSMGPKLVADQSNERMREPISPPPAGQSESDEFQRRSDCSGAVGITGSIIVEFSERKSD
jgi:hypothetical protein